jgi:hypothetical protein
MDRASEELLPGAGFASDQHGHVGRRHTPPLLEHPRQQSRLPHDAVKTFDRTELGRTNWCGGR